MAGRCCKKRKVLGCLEVPGIPVQACSDVLGRCPGVQDQCSLALHGRCSRHRSEPDCAEEVNAAVPPADSLPRQLPEQRHRHSLEGSASYDIREF